MELGFGNVDFKEEEKLESPEKNIRWVVSVTPSQSQMVGERRAFTKGLISTTLYAFTAS